VSSIEPLGMAKISIKNTLIEMARRKMATIEIIDDTKLCLRIHTKTESFDLNRTQIRNTNNTPRASQYSPEKVIINSITPNTVS
jgi:hypothetical protein